MVKKFLILLLLICMHGTVTAITVGTYNLPPFSMNEDGEYIGMVTEALQTLLKRADIKKNNYLEYPLARGLAELRAGHIDLFYPYVKVDEQDMDEFILIGPIAKYSVALFVRKDYKQNVSLSSMHNLIVGAERGSIEDLLIKKHTLHIDHATGGASCLRMVLAERVSACAIGTLPGQYVAALNDLTPQLRYAETGSYANMYLAIRKKLPKELVIKIEKAFYALKRENYFVNQQKAYEERFALFLKSLS